LVGRGAAEPDAAADGRADALAAALEAADGAALVEAAADAEGRADALAAALAAAADGAALAAPAVLADAAADDAAAEGRAVGAGVAVALAPHAARIAVIAEADSPSATARLIKSRRLTCPATNSLVNDWIGSRCAMRTASLYCNDGQNNGATPMARNPPWQKRRTLQRADSGVFAVPRPSSRQRGKGAMLTWESL
jgi:hypothetical protein